MNDENVYYQGSRVTCPHCQEKVNLGEPMRVRGGQSWQQESEWVPLTFHWVCSRGRSEWALVGFLCPVCDFPILVIGADIGLASGTPWPDQVIYPRFRSRAPDPAVPEGIAKDWREAWAILDISPRASAALSRRCMEAILLEATSASPRTNLAGLLKLAEQRFPAHLHEELDHVRQLGNIAVHLKADGVTGEILDIEENEAQLMLQVLDDLLEFFYVQPARSRERRATLQAKIDRSKGS